MAEQDRPEPLEQRRARNAYQWLSELKDAGRLEKVEKRVQGLPIEVRSQGLNVALATLLKENREESRTLADRLALWLLRDANVDSSSSLDAPTGRALLDRAVKGERAEYLALQAQGLAYLEHVKRLASALQKAGK